MTDEFKQKLMKYFLGKLSKETGDNVPQFLETRTITNNFDTYCKENISPYHLQLGEIQAKSISGDLLPYNILYGLTINSDYSYTGGYILLTDDEYNPIKSFTTYSTGTQIGYLRVLNVDENGYLYGVEKAIETETERFIMLNNITASINGDYTLKLRQSYNLPTTLDVYSNVLKANGSANYLITGTKQGAEGKGYLYAHAITLKINVGSENEWQDYSDTTASEYQEVIDTYATWDDNDNCDFLMIGYQQTSTGSSGGGNTRRVVAWQSVISDDSYYLQRYERDFIYNDVSCLPTDAKIINKNLIYVTTYDIPSYNYDKHHIFVWKYDFENDTNTIILDKTPSKINDAYDQLDFIKVDNQVFYHRETCIAMDEASVCTNAHYFGKIYNDTYVESLITTDNYDSNFSTSVTKQFNLYNYVYQSGDVACIKTQIYNSSNYNGLEYENINSLKSNSAVIYDANNIPIFARNLYNRTINQNVTVSTIEVPNNYLNDVTIANKNLVSETNGIMNIDNTMLNTNIYETLYLNWLNEITIQNQNDATNPINNLTAAVRLNNSISNLTDYDECKADKIRINYSDNTSFIRILADDEIIYNSEGSSYEFVVIVPSTKNISSIEFISDDEVTTYQTINPTFELNKTYKIIQKVAIGE